MTLDEYEQMLTTLLLEIADGFGIDKLWQTVRLSLSEALEYEFEQRTGRCYLCHEPIEKCICE